MREEGREGWREGGTSKAHIILNICSRCMCYYVLSVPHVGVIGIVKAGAYGHGSVHVSRHLKATGVEKLAVATVDEAIHLRHHDISGPIHILGKRTVKRLEFY